MEPIIKAENIRVTYNEGKDNEFTALKNISLEVYPEEYLIFFGPSGCGKSTMLYTLLGVQTPTSGKVFINGKDSSSFSEAEKSRTSSQFFGIVFQNFNLIYSLNVADNVMLPQVFLGSPLKKRKERGEQLMERFGIVTRAKNLPNNLSGGQQQRVAICRALINDPQILLADEPVGNLDSESAKVVMQTLSEINRKDKKTIILVTHDPSYLPFADRVYYFKDAKIDRVVKNDRPLMPDDVLSPGQKQLTTEPDRKEYERLANFKPNLSIGELKAWILTKYLVEELTADQMERLENNMVGLLDGSLTQSEFERMLNVSFKNGGVGLYHATAHKYGRKVGDVINMVHNIKNLSFKKGEDRNKKMAELIRMFVISEYTHELEPEQSKNLNEAILARLNNEIKHEELVWLLTQPPEKGGAHLRATTASRLVEKMEIILAEAE